MTTPNTKPVVRVTDILISIEDARYFAIPEEYATFPFLKKVNWVALGSTEECWIEVFPVTSSDSEGIDDFKDDLEVTVDLDNSFLPPWSSYEEIKDWRWFALLADS